MKEHTPTASVVMPVYNGERFLAEAIESILAQSFTDFEFLIVDDGSTDQSREIIQHYSDPRIVYLAFPSNKGFIDALDYGLRHAQGKWIARMDCDDMCDPNRLEKQIEFLESHPGFVFLSTISNLISPAGKLLQRKEQFSGWKSISQLDLTTGNHKMIDPSVVYLRKAALDAGGYDFELKYEIPFWYRLLTQGTGAVLYEPLYYYRFRLDSLSRDNSDRESKRLISRSARLKYDPERAHLHSSWDKSTFPTAQELRKGVYLKAINLCNVTRDLGYSSKIFLSGFQEFPFDKSLLRVYLKGIVNFCFFFLKLINFDYFQVYPTIRSNKG